jgi:hypothetical protein
LPNTQNLTLKFSEVHLHMKVNLYPIVERAVFEGSALGFSKIANDPTIADSPEKVIEAVANAVLVELCQIFVFEEDESVPVSVTPPQK